MVKSAQVQPDDGDSYMGTEIPHHSSNSYYSKQESTSPDPTTRIVIGEINDEDDDYDLNPSMMNRNNNDNPSMMNRNNNDNLLNRGRRMAITSLGIIDDELDILLSAVEAPYQKLQDKLTFFFGVLQSFLIVFMLYSPFKFVLLYYFTIMFLILVPWRFYCYYKLHYEYFLFDYCYFANLVLIIYIWFLPDKPELFVISFCAAVGPLITAVPLFRNSLVFHSCDKLFSCMLHILPYVVCLVIRHHQIELEWYGRCCCGGDHYYGTHNNNNQSSNGGNIIGFNNQSEEEAMIKTIYNYNPMSYNISNNINAMSNNDNNRIYYGGIPINCSVGPRFNLKFKTELTYEDAFKWSCLYYWGHWVFYMLIIKIIYPLPADDPKYLTSYRLLVQRKTLNFLNKIPFASFHPIYYVLWNFIMFLLVLLPSPFWYNSGLGMTIFGWFCISISIWNAANFYIEIFGKQKNRKAKKLDYIKSKKNGDHTTTNGKSNLKSKQNGKDTMGKSNPIVSNTTVDEARNNSTFYYDTSTKKTDETTSKTDETKAKTDETMAKTDETMAKTDNAMKDADV